MKVYASSFRLCSQPQRFLRLFGGSVRVAVISNALDFAADDAWRHAWMRRDTDDLRALGLQPEDVDLRVPCIEAALIASFGA